MSKETKRALDDALAAHIMDEAGRGALVSGYALFASYITARNVADNCTSYFAVYAPDQPMHATLGLVEQHRLKLGYEIGASRV